MLVHLCARRLYAVGRIFICSLRTNLSRSPAERTTPIPIPPHSFDSPKPTQKSNEGNNIMKTINLRDYYPFYYAGTLLEVSDEVAQAMAEAERLERNYNTLIIKLLFPLRKPIKFDTLRRILQLPDSKLMLH